MKNQIKLLVILVVVAFSTTKMNAQINIDFKTIADTAHWTGAQANLSVVDNNYMQIEVTGGFWAVAAYAPKDGIVWNFDENKVVVVKVQEKFGDLSVKFYDKTADKNYIFNDPMPLTVNNTTNLIHVIAFENFVNTYPEIASGTKTFANIQIAHEYVSIGQKILVDWIKTFPSIDAAYEYVGPIVDGTAAVHSLTDSPVRIYVVNSNIKITKMEKEESVNVFDTKGSLIKSQRMMNGEISNLNKGVYIVKTNSKIAKVVL